ncbi:MAG: FAD-binding oxidoreductase [Rhodobacteraceae bacterium]|nr:FAD-binding oxidoreductase [Paracoccaceae bacterium]
MIANERSVIANSLWTATANRAPDCPPPNGDYSTDVVVIGGGFTGLSAALHLAGRGVAVSVLEAETPGWGASGRNGGQVNPGLKDDPDAILRRFGPETGARLNRLSGGAADLVFDLIDRHGIDCAPVRAGWIRAAHNIAARDALADVARAWQAHGAPVERLNAAEMQRLLGTRAYVGGIIDRRGGNLHPLNYALGLADAAARAGARLHGQSRVTGITVEDDLHHVSTAQGTISARRVLICTNAYSGRLDDRLRRSIVPVRSVQVATAPLPDDLRAAILPERQAPSDQRRLLLYFRMDPQGRFVMGGRGTLDDPGTKAQMAALRRAAVMLYPALADADWQYGWGGNVAITADHLPRLTRLGQGVLAGYGYNGRGVAMATAMGRVMADWASGTRVADLDAPVGQPRPMPLHGMRELAVAAAVTRARVMDWLGV